MVDVVPIIMSIYKYFVIKMITDLTFSFLFFFLLKDFYSKSLIGHSISFQIAHIPQSSINKLCNIFFSFTFLVSYAFIFFPFQNENFVAFSSKRLTLSHRINFCMTCRLHWQTNKGILQLSYMKVFDPRQKLWNSFELNVSFGLTEQAISYTLHDSSISFAVDMQIHDDHFITTIKMCIIRLWHINLCNILDYIRYPNLCWIET